MSRRTALRKSREVVEKLEGDEEFFPLLGRDRATPIVIRIWAHVWLTEIRMGARPESDRAQVKAGLDMASRMEIRLRDASERKDHADTEWGPPDPLDGSRVPLNGPHARLARNTTSGANDG